MRILVTGGAGFIGSNFIRHLLATDPTCRIVNLDKLTYAGNLENLTDVEGDRRYQFIKGSICDAAQVDTLLSEGFDALVNFAAESHVDRSIQDARAFVETNVLGTQTLLEACRRYRVSRMLQVSTDEVYGSLGPSGRFTEESPLHPNSPYAASKAAGDMLVSAYFRTYGLPVIITRSSNNYGPQQFPEKAIPLFITNALVGEPLPMYGDGLYVRDWLHVQDHCEALALVLRSGAAGDIYNIGGNCERANIDVAHFILRTLGKPKTLITHVRDRLGHDRRYALNTSKIEQVLGWKPRIPFETGLEDTIHWYERHTTWWTRIKGGQYREYYRKTYGDLSCVSQ
ncbi:spore coat protein [Candidatus Methylomirabilis lanthanidiphila]|uniref:dTDP-glucose 4,6-dehydratase n=1 Tax=Candidatus Methylomirabilis lanthanidiphila TaxID=2211376 RepID=A0A564ZLN0_9BACT|nr:dTDP-glucose 4,6-dehydratase [Candidatus Methylomirabilis lanthanidiphila]VUZ85767.1 spore coat protein [Candidatus Methylomirabilis lanthanidiphila]